MQNTDVCNEIWKPISTDSSPSEKHEEEATDRFMKNTNGANAFEKRFETNCWACGSSIDTDIYNLVKGLTRPYPGAFTYLQGAKFIVWRTRLSPDGTDESAPGTIISSTSAGVLVSTGGNAMLITDYQWSGGKISKKLNGDTFEYK